MNKQLNIDVSGLCDYINNLQNKPIDFYLLDVIMLQNNTFTSMFKSIQKSIQKSIKSNNYHGIHYLNIKQLIEKFNSIEYLLDFYITNIDYNMYTKLELSEKQYYIQIKREYLIAFYNHFLKHLK